MTARVGAILLTLVTAVISGIAALVGLVWGFGLTCDESCSDRATVWTEDHTAWQWDALGSTGIAAFLFGLALTGFVSVGEKAVGAIVLAAWTAAAVFAAILNADFATPELVWLAFIVAAAAAAGALALTPKRSPRAA